MTRRGGRAALAIAAISLTVTGAALAAAGGYTGRTSQRQAVSFTISSGDVRNFKIVIHDMCPDGHILRANYTYPTMKIANAKFGGEFTPLAAHPGEHSTLRGTEAAREVTGTISDTAFSHREQKLCHGTATFTARPL
jgi:hypothetical protein